MLDTLLLYCTCLYFPARKFPNRPDYSLVVNGFFNKECLDTDPVPHGGPTMQINTELAWEMSKKDLQYHKLHRTPIKLLVICFAFLTYRYAWSIYYSDEDLNALVTNL